MWPDGFGLRVNPGGDNGIEVAAADVLPLLSINPAEIFPPPGSA
jgi:hypothetical protein